MIDEHPNLADKHPKEERILAADAAWRIYGVVNEWVRYADAKAGVLLAADAAVLAAALGAVKDHKEFLRGSPLFAVFGGIGLAALIGSAVGCLLCILPRLKFPGLPQHRPAPAAGARSLVYFGDIAGFEESGEYVGDLHQLGDSDRALHEIGRQIWVNSRIARRKYGLITVAVWPFFLGLSLCLLVFAFAAVSPDKSPPAAPQQTGVATK